MEEYEKIYNKETMEINLGTRGVRGASQFPNTLYGILIYAVIKVYATKEHPLTANQIAAYLEQWIVGEYGAELLQNEDKKLDAAKDRLRVGKNNYLYGENLAKSVRNYLNTFTTLFDTAYVVKGSEQFEVDPHVVLYLVACFGGVVRSEQYTSKRVRYYFDPFLSEGNLGTLKGSIITNQYLSPEEKQLLVQVCPLVNGGDRVQGWVEKMVQNNAGLRKIPKEEIEIISINKLLGNHSHPSYDTINGRLLRNVEIVYNNLTAQTPMTIKILGYGRYGMGKDAKKMSCLDAANNYIEKKEYLINPYGFLWKNGYCYLIATHNSPNKYTNVVYFRMDRVMDLCLGEFQREPVPSTLQPYMIRDEEQRLQFSPELFLQKHPMMARYEEENLVKAELACTAKTVSLVVDIFGNVPMKAADINIEAFDHGYKLEWFVTSVEAQYEDLVEFCTEFHKDVLVSNRQSKLYQDVQEQLKKSMAWYQ